jgi:hypothetical protein
MSIRRFSPAWMGVVLACAVLSAGLIAPTGADARRVYKGKTAQSRTIKVAVGKRNLKIMRFKAELKCRDGSVLIDDESGFLPTPIRSNGSFRDAQVGSTDEVLIRGRRKGRVVRGRLRVRDRVGKVRCSSKWIKFTARAGK